MSRRTLRWLSGLGLAALVLLNTASGVTKIGFSIHQLRLKGALTRADLGAAYSALRASFGWQPDEAPSHVLVARVFQLALANGLPVPGLEDRSPAELLALGTDSVAQGIALNPADAWAWFELAQVWRGFQAGRLRQETLRAAGRRADDQAPAPGGDSPAGGQGRAGPPSSGKPLEPEDAVMIAATLKARELDPELYFHHDFLATLYWQRDRVDDTAREVEESFSLMPLLTSHPLLIRHNLHKSLPEAALRGIERARSHPLFDTGTVALAKADLLLNLERLDEAIAALEELGPGRAAGAAIEIDLRIGQLHLKADRVGESLPYLERVLATDPDGGLGTRALSSIGSARSRLGDHQGAITAYKRYLRRKPGALRSYLALAGEYRAAGHLDDAESLYRAALQRFPSDLQAHLYWIRFLRSQKRLTEALEAAKEAELLAPENAAVRSMVQALEQASSR